MAFTHLHVHTEYSLLDGSSRIKEIIARAKELGMDSLAITDHGVMYGVIDFYKAAKKAGVKPILGCEVYVAPGSRFDREAGQNDDRYNHLILLAENNTGYSNLMKIVSRGFTEGFYYKPRVDKEILREFHEGVICCSACLAGEVQRYLTRRMYENAKEVALEYQEIFGKGNFFLELQDHGIAEQQYVNQELMRMSAETGIELICSNDVHYTYASDADAHDILLCIQTGKKVSDEDRMRYDGGQFYLKSEDEMRELFGYAPQALENTAKIAARCDVEIEFGVTKLPNFPVPEGYTSWTYLNYLCYKGLKENYPALAGDISLEDYVKKAESEEVSDRSQVVIKPANDSENIFERLEYELSVIHSMGYVEYFLIVWDYINYARTHDIPVGPGRGSAVGSIVSYTLGITALDPIKYTLIFERFLNPERVSMPDIDTDFDYERRQDVIEYVNQKYGKDCVVQIVTFGTMAARAAIKDVGRALDLPYNKVDSIAKMVPQKIGMTIDLALTENADLKQLYEDDDEVTNLIDKAKRLEGLPRHASVHASGVLISQKQVEEYVPVSGSSDVKVAQFTMTTLEELGLLKMDFLGLRTLTVIKDAERMIQEKVPGFRTDTLECNDKKVFDAIATGKCAGIFQLESAGMQSFMKELKPNCIEDLIAGISLYRPGPMDFIPKYIKGKNNSDSIVYDCPQLEHILQPTYGCIVYQEQVMQIVRDLAGYSWGRSDLVRRAMAKKKTEVMQKERTNFIYGNEEEGVTGCVKNGISEDVANKIFDEMIDFAKYAFNKSHAACYAVVAYQTAYLKTYYPKEFMAALMTSVMDRTSKISQYIFESRQMHIRILPPDVNSGEFAFRACEDGIIYGLSAIKGLGKPTIDALVKEREHNGKFTSLENFIQRMYGEINKRTLENLIKAGALDCFGAKRRQMMFVYAAIMDNVGRNNKDMMAGQMSLFEMLGSEDLKKDFEIKMPDVEEFSKEEMLRFEREVLGIFVSGHPLDEYSKFIEKHITADSTKFDAEEDEDGTVLDNNSNEFVSDGMKATIAGIVSEINVKTNKDGKNFAYVTLEDLFGAVEVLVFAKNYALNRDKIVQDSKVLVTGRVSANVGEKPKLISDRIFTFDEVAKRCWIKFRTTAEYEAARDGLFRTIESYEGTDEVVIYCEDTKKRELLPKNRTVSANSRLIQHLKSLYGDENVVIL